MGWFDFLPDVGLGDIAESVGGLFGGGGGGGGGTSGGGDGLFDAFGKYLKSPTGIGQLLTTGLGLYGQVTKSDLEREQSEAALAAQKENERFKFLTELAKLKYLKQGGGGGGGGGGAGTNRNAELIKILSAGQTDMQQALNALTTGYVSALK